MEEYFVEEKSNLDRVLDFLVFVAVFAVTIFLILELLAEYGAVSTLSIEKIGATYYYVNVVVFIIFIVDLFRLWKQSEGPGDFFKNNYLDVLATIPFGLIAALIAGIPQTSPKFEILKVFRLTKLSRVSKLSKISRISKISKEFKAAAHLKREGEQYKKKHRL